MSRNFNDIVREILVGAIDVHVNVGPDPARRLLDTRTVVNEARLEGMKGFVAKSHMTSTTNIASLVSEQDGVQVFGSLCLNHEVGGLNPLAVETAVQTGARKIWLPTSAAANDRKSTPEYILSAVKSLGKFYHPEPSSVSPPAQISLLDENGRLVTPLQEILRLAKQYEAVVATGMVAAKEQFVLARETKALGVRTIITYADYHHSKDAQRDLASLGAFLEHSYVFSTEPYGCMRGREVAANIRHHGARSGILSTNSGQIYSPSPVSGLRSWCAAMLREGISEQDIITMVRTNPSELLRV